MGVGAVAAAGISAYGSYASAQEYADAQASGAAPGGMSYEDYLSMMEDQAQMQLDYNRQMIDMNLEYLPQYGKAERHMTNQQRRADLRYLDRRGTQTAGELGQVSQAYAGLGDAALQARQQLGAGPGQYAPAINNIGRATLNINDPTRYDPALNNPGAGALEAFNQGPIAGLGQLNFANPGRESVQGFDRGSVQAEIDNPNPLLGTLQGQAANDLALGRSLSGEQVRDSQQGARAGMAARGMATGNQSLFAEVLNRDRFASGREADRRQFASSVFGMGLQNDQVNMARRNFLLEANNSDRQYGQMAIDSQRDFSLSQAGLQLQDTNALRNQQMGRSALQLDATNAQRQAELARLGLGLQGTADNRGFTLSSANMQLENTNARRNFEMSRANTLLNANNAQRDYELAGQSNNRNFLLSASGAQLNPVLSSIYGNRTGVSMNAPMGAAGAAPHISGAQDYFNTQFNANAAANISANNNQAALLGAGINTVSQLGGQYMQTRQANALPARAASAPASSTSYSALSYRPANMPTS